MATFLDTLSERVAALRAPISADKPAGDDVSYDPEFEKVQREIDKLTALAGERPNWVEVQQGTEQLLTGKSKDLRLASWLVVAKTQRSGWPGLAEGLLAYRFITLDFWEQLYPPVKRGRARGNLAGWISDQLGPLLADRSVSAADGDAIRAAESTFAELDAYLSEKLGSLYPGMGGLRSALRDKLRQVPAEEPPAPPPKEPEPAAPASPTAAAPVAMPTPEPAAASVAAPVSAPSPIAPPTALVTSADDAIDALRACTKTIQEAARQIRKADPAQAFPYRLQRLGTWLVVRGAPPAEGGRTRIPPPRDDVKRRIENLLAGEKWLELLSAAEDATGTYLFWLDMHRLVALSMDRLGALFLPAREVVGREVSDFVQRFPAITTLGFADGTAFADAATKAWLEEEAKKYAGGGAGGKAAASQAVQEEEEEIAKRFAQAREWITTGKIAEGLALAMQLAARAGDARARFRARLTVAQLGLQGGKPQSVRPLLEALVEEAQTHGLEHWEPALCATLYSTMVSCLRGIPADRAVDGEQKQALFLDKLCRLDPAAALRLLE